MSRTTIARAFAVAGAAVAVAALAGCSGSPSGSGEESTLTPGTASATASATTTAGASASPSVTVGDEGGSGDLADGTYYAYLEGVDVQAGTVDIDVADLYFGDEAVERNGGEAPANDYLVVNDDTTVRTLPMAADADITVAGADAGDVPNTIDVLATDAIDMTAYWIVTVDAGTVTVFEGVYAP